MKMFTLLPLIAIFWTSGVAALLSTCPQKSAQTNFNTSDVLGTWNFIKYTSPKPFPCASGTFSLKETGHLVLKTKFFNSTGNNYVIKTYTFDKEDPSSTEAKFRSVDADGSRFTIGSLLYVLSTDYTNYAVIWGCSKRSTGEMEAAEYAEFGVLLSRTTSLPAQTLIEATTFLPSNEYRLADHSNCPQL